MAKKKDIIIIFIAVILLITSSILIIKNKYDDERSVYVAFFRQFEHESYLKDVAFLSVTSNCDATYLHMREASKELFDAFYSANDNEKLPNNISKFSSMVNVVSWEDTLKLHQAQSPYIANVNSEKNITQISQIGFDGKKGTALMCMQTNFSATIFMFKKLDSGKWELFKYRNIWIS